MKCWSTILYYLCWSFFVLSIHWQFAYIHFFQQCQRCIICFSPWWQLVTVRCSATSITVSCANSLGGSLPFFQTMQQKGAAANEFWANMPLKETVKHVSLPTRIRTVKATSRHAWIKTHHWPRWRDKNALERAYIKCLSLIARDRNNCIYSWTEFVLLCIIIAPCSHSTVHFIRVTFCSNMF
jgi:hypothetical protein